jgi:hypothetical protein
VSRRLVTRRTRPKEDPVIVADVSFIDIFWSMLEFFFLFIWILILFHILSDLFRDHSLSGGPRPCGCCSWCSCPLWPCSST